MLANHTSARCLTICLLVTLGNSGILAQDTPPPVEEPLLPPIVPQLIPDPSMELPPLVVDPEPILNEPGFPPAPRSYGTVRPAEMVERREADPSSSVDTSLQGTADGAASAFGFDSGQGAFTRPSIAGAQAERELQRMTARAERQANLEHYNVKIGPIPFRFGAGVEFGFSDNVNLTKDNKLSDLTIFPHFDIYGGVRIFRQNLLSIQLGVGYIWNLNRPELDRALTNASIGLDSDTGISFDLKLGNFRINLHERPAIPRQQFDLVTQRSPLQYSQFTNVAGVTVFWDVNSRTSATLTYDHLNVISLKSEVENLDQSSDRFGASITYRLGDAVTFGLQANASLIKYKRRFLNEAKNYDAGLTMSARLGRNTTLHVMAGYQIGEFSGGGEVGDNSDISDWHGRVAVNHTLNRYSSQSLSMGHESQVGTASNATSVNYIRYNVNFSISRVLGLSGSASFDSASESGGVFARDFKFFQLGAYGYWNLSKKLSMTLGYRFVKRIASEDDDSLEGPLDYVENRIDLGVQVHL